MRTVYLLGAGASAEAGVPTSSEILTVAYDLCRRMDSEDPSIEGLKPLLAGNAHAALKTVFSFIADYFHQGELAVDWLPSPNMLLSVIDLHTQNERPLWRSPGQALDRVRLLELRRAVVLVILLSLEVYLHYQPERRPCAPYRAFIDRLDASDTVISLNQDYLLDWSLWECQLSVDYALGPFEVTRNEIEGGDRPVTLLKPHGSINWLRCPTCERLMILREAGGIRSLEILAGPHGMPPPDSDRLRCPIDGQVGEPVIIPPTLYKPLRDPLMGYLLAEATRRIAESARLVIIGCSLQESDTHLIAWLKEGLAQGQGKITIEAVNRNEEVIRHFQRLFGPRLKAHPVNFSDFVNATATS